MTLAEIVIGMAVFTLVDVGIIALTVQSRRMAESAIRENTAATVTQGYLEQIKSIEYSALVDGDPKYSILFEHTRYPESQVGLALFSRTEFVTGIESVAWDRYLSSLSYSYPLGPEVISDRGPEETARMFPILGAPFRELTYRYQLDQESPAIFRREYLVVLNDRLLLGVAETTEPYFQAVSRSVRSLLVGMYQVK